MGIVESDLGELRGRLGVTLQALDMMNALVHEMKLSIPSTHHTEQFRDLTSKADRLFRTVHSQAMRQSAGQAA